jgi:hypothetical protein
MLFAAVTWKRVPTAAASGALRGRQFFYAQFFTGVTSAQPCAHVERRRGRRMLGERLSFSPFVDGVVSQEHVAKKSQRHDICRPAAGGDARGSPTLSHRTFTPAFVASVHLKRSRFRPPGFAHSPHRWFSIGLPLAGELGPDAVPPDVHSGLRGLRSLEAISLSPSRLRSLATPLVQHRAPPRW